LESGESPVAIDYVGGNFGYLEKTSMRKIILGLAVSLDGYIEGPNGEYDWCFTDQDYGMIEFFKRVDAMFIGRKSYEVLSAQEGVGGFPKLKQYIFSGSVSLNG
jgi:dihydrofolate reductase